MYVKQKQKHVVSYHNKNHLKFYIFKVWRLLKFNDTGRKSMKIAFLLNLTAKYYLMRSSPTLQSEAMWVHNRKKKTLILRVLVS